MKCPSLKQLSELLAPYKDIIIFIITLFVANYFWKFTVFGDEAGEMVTWFGLDITAPFAFLSDHILRMVYWLVSLVRDTVHAAGDTLYFDSGAGTRIVRGCTGLKQAFIWFWLIFTVRGAWGHKLWYIPLGWLVCYAFNILRIAAIALLIEHHPDWFYIIHEWIFKYLFYLILFGLWVLFVEKIRPLSSAR